MGSLFGSSQKASTQTVNNDPWSGIQPQLQQAAGDTQKLYNQGLLNQTYYPGNTVTPFAPETQQALDMTAQRATTGSPVENSAKGLLTDTLNGNYLNSNPNLDATYNQASKAVQGTINGAFGQGGRYGSGLNQQALGNSLSGLATGIYGQNYQDERNRQNQGILLAPQIANQDYTDLNALGNVGNTKQQQGQQELQSNIDRYNFNQQAPGNNIQDYINLLNGAGGKYGSQTSTTPYYQNNTANTMGLLGGLFGSGQGGGASTASGLFSTAMSLASLFPPSDIRLKEDITPIGYENGFPTYTFRYKNDPDKTLYRGVMAQDVIKTNPEAVHEIDGYYAVNYNKIGVEFSAIH